jgi:carotenoid cleavage dioxygenase-like enzyme
VINCFETDAHLVVDVLLLDAPIYPHYRPLPDLFVEEPPCRPMRYTIDLETRELVGMQSMAYAQSPDFPSIDPVLAGRATDDFWLLGMSQAGKTGRKFFDELAHGSWTAGGVNDIYRTPPGEYLGGEPAFVANPAVPEEAVVITQILKPAEQITEIAIFDAFALRSGPMVSIPLRHPLHPGFHSSFAPSPRPVGGRPL